MSIIPDQWELCVNLEGVKLKDLTCRIHGKGKALGDLRSIKICPDLSCEANPGAVKTISWCPLTRFPMDKLFIRTPEISAVS